MINFIREKLKDKRVKIGVIVGAVILVFLMIVRWQSGGIEVEVAKVAKGNILTTVSFYNLGQAIVANHLK